MLAEEGEHLAPAIHCLLGVIEWPVPIENAVAGSIVALEEFVHLLLELSCWFTCSGLGARSSLPTMPSSGQQRSFVISTGATGVLALSSSLPITTRPPQRSGHAAHPTARAIRMSLRVETVKTPALRTSARVLLVAHHNDDKTATFLGHGDVAGGSDPALKLLAPIAVDGRRAMSCVLLWLAWRAGGGP